MSQSSDHQFGKYELLDRIAAGGMAEIFKARFAPAPGVTKQVVIKKILPHYAANKGFIAMFTNEARIAMGLSHGNIAQVFDFGAIDGDYYLAMELVDGQPLSKVLRRAKAMGIAALPPEFAVFSSLEMLKGLQYAHTRLDEAGRPLQIVHRDISPQNVLVSYEGQIKLVDFGIARARNAGPENTASNAVQGKYAYFAPEQARGKEVDARTDVFATGIVLYELLTGQLPFQGKMVDAISRIVRGLFPRPREVNPTVPSELEAIVLKAMAIEKGERYQSAEAFGLALTTFLSTTYPTFTPTQLGYLVQMLFEEDLVREGRPIKLPRDFVEKAQAWKHPASTAASKADSTVSSEPDFAEAFSAENPTEHVALPRRAAGDVRETAAARVGSTAPLPVHVPVSMPAIEAVPYVVTEPLPAAAPRPRPSASTSGKKKRPRGFPVVRALLLVAAASAVGFGGIFVAARASKGTLEIVSVPPGAEVRVDGVLAHRGTPLVLEDLDGARTYRVEVSSSGFRPWVNQVPLKRGQHLVVRATLDVEPPPAPPVVATLEPEPQKAPPARVAPPPAPPVPNEVSWPRAPVFELDAAKHHVDLSRAGVRAFSLDPAQTYRMWLSKGPTFGWGFYVVNPAGAQPGPLSLTPLQIKGASRLFVYRLTAGSLGGGVDERRPRAFSVQAAGKKKPTTENLSGGLEVPASARVTVKGLSPASVYELSLSPGTPPAKKRDTGAALTTAAVGTPMDGLLVVTPGSPVRLTRISQFFVTLIDDEADVQEGRLKLTLRDVTPPSPKHRR